jgi:formamidopyrimidine-DNA glycosylase
MPELPDVEIYRRRLEEHAMKRSFTEARIFDERLLDQVTARQLKQALVSHRIVATKRHGKCLLVELDDGSLLTLHFGMTGDIVPLREGQDLPRYTVLQLLFNDRTGIAITSRRKLGHIGLTKNMEVFTKSQGLGVDALDPALDRTSFRAALGSARSAIKSALMDQSKLCGIGNIYSDEILFQAGLNPRKQVGNLDASEIDGLFKTVRRVLQEAIRRGVLSEGFEGAVPGGWLLAHRERGGRCPRCGEVLQTSNIAGRTAYFCASCQAQ